MSYKSIQNYFIKNIGSDVYNIIIDYSDEIKAQQIERFRLVELEIRYGKCKCDCCIYKCVWYN